MAKIYNEIIIDMNPESHSYMEVLHEDSFEYEDSMMLMQGGLDWTKEKQPPAVHPPHSLLRTPDGKVYYWSKGGTYKEADEKMISDLVDSWRNWEIVDFNPETQRKGLGTEYGAENIKKEMFVNPDGSPRTRDEIFATLKPLFPGLDDTALAKQIDDFMPRFQAVPEEEKQFAKEAMKKDVYGISKEARKVGAQARGVYGGTGASMRGAMTGTEDIAKGFEQAQQAYQQDLYGLEKGAAESYEADIAQWIEPDWFKGREGGLVHKDRSGIGNNRRFNEETFLDVLTQLPDAGGS